MATPAMTNFYTVNETEAKLIVDAPKTKIIAPAYADKFHLSTEVRKQRALDVLKKWK